jgi:hypothetical protein
VVAEQIEASADEEGEHKAHCAVDAAHLLAPIGGEGDDGIAGKQRCESEVRAAAIGQRADQDE